MEVYVKISFIFIFSFFQVFNTNFIRCVGFTLVSASNTASDDVTNYVIYRILNTDLLYSFANFIVKIYEKFSLNDGF